MASVLEGGVFDAASVAERQRLSLRPAAQVLGRLIGRADRFFDLPLESIERLDLRPPVTIRVVKPRVLPFKTTELGILPGQLPFQSLANEVDTVKIVVPAADRYPG